MVRSKVLNRELPVSSRNARIKIAEIIQRVNASHIGSCFSIVEILDAIYKSVDLVKIKTNVPDRDRVIISKGHAAAAVYTVLAEKGLITQDLLESYGTDGSPLSGCINHLVPCIEHSTGALGHGLSVAVGICLGMRTRHYDKTNCYVIVGDGELQEGSNWEALMLAGYLNLNHLCVLVDDNELGAYHELPLIRTPIPLRNKMESFGFEVREVDGHDTPAILAAIADFKRGDNPFAIICHTIKGKGASFMEGQNVWHYRPPSKDDCRKLKDELFGVCE